MLNICKYMSKTKNIKLQLNNQYRIKPWEKQKNIKNKKRQLAKETKEIRQRKKENIKKIKN